MTIGELLIKIKELLIESLILFIKPFQWAINLSESLASLIFKIIKLQILDITLSEIGCVFLLIFLLCLMLYFINDFPDSSGGQEVFLFFLIWTFFLIFCIYAEVTEDQKFQKFKSRVLEISGPSDIFNKDPSP
jgi:hypothetical protein